ncbi:MAG: hypothetical protein KDA51_18105, partial [Planctomycetales bacterium]|nr:hypothetical protein [Planctomycetales bacterium]
LDKQAKAIVAPAGGLQRWHGHHLGADWQSMRTLAGRPLLQSKATSIISTQFNRVLATLVHQAIEHDPWPVDCRLLPDPSAVVYLQEL